MGVIRGAAMTTSKASGPRKPWLDPDTDHGLGGRLIAAFVAALFFAPLLVVAWWLCNLQFAWFTGQWLPGKILLGAIAASASLGLVLPRATPTVLDWFAQGLYRLARLWW